MSAQGRDVVGVTDAINTIEQSRQGLPSQSANVLDADALVGAVHFYAGTPWYVVIEQAQLHYKQWVNKK